MSDHRPLPLRLLRGRWPLPALVGVLMASFLWIGGKAAQAPAAQGPATPPQPTLQDAQARETFLRVCTKCHPVERVIAEGRSRSQWEATMISMQTARAAVIAPEEFDVILDYLSRHHGRESLAAPGRGTSVGPGGRGPRAHVGAADRHRVDDTAAARGQKTYAAECVTCHAPSARGTDNPMTNLIRSPLVLRDRYGSSLGPFLKKGHPTQTGAPSASLTQEQIVDLSHFIWQRVNDTLQGSAAYTPKDVLTGDAKAGQAYFNGEGGCASCHSPTGDLARYGALYDPVDIQQRFVFPTASAGRGRAPRKPVTVTITVPGSPALSGTLVAMDDFHVALREADGQYRSIARTPAMTVVKSDPYQAHVDLLERLTDRAMHDVVAYLETLK